jgi:hypothetical protein
VLSLVVDTSSSGAYGLATAKCTSASSDCSSVGA